MVGLTMDYLEITGLDLETQKNLLSSYKEQLPSLPDLITVSYTHLTLPTTLEV